ncbi:Hypothetical Protein FCC1311_081102 [Hondaea fermentalgiana]|uniref:F-box domain-containing protein n=1 Tax=Hondaea fermentalgiana TaxID=2315210 RepID=A0A2R5GMN1_9STRA|nr:Hypothetical Protein FCC1311_081102 [Hondaea fermentalgiana]|eukprot:GBG31885.1 Hypothetical Protein FCC1311_081102 [Hondaea fermentalgiana]
MSAMPTEYQLRASALTLQFGELWQSVAAESARENARHRAGGGPAARGSAQRGARFEYFGRLDCDVVEHVLQFADPRSLGALSVTCRTMMRFCTAPRREMALWTPHRHQLEKRLRVRELPAPGAPGDAKRAYLRLCLLETEAELRHFKTQLKLLSALCQMPKGAVVRLVSNIGYFDDAAISLAVSSYRQYAMSAVILSRSNDAIVFRKCTDYRGPVSFYSQDNISTLLTPHPSIAMQPIRAPGFLGYAVNLVRLSPDEEYMRYTFLLAAYKNLTVWASEKELRAARASGALPDTVSACAIDAFAPASIAETPEADAEARRNVPLRPSGLSASSSHSSLSTSTSNVTRPAAAIGLPDDEDAPDLERPEAPTSSPASPMTPLKAWLRFGSLGNEACPYGYSVSQTLLLELRSSGCRKGSIPDREDP